MNLLGCAHYNLGLIPVAEQANPDPAFRHWKPTPRLYYCQACGARTQARVFQPAPSLAPMGGDKPRGDGRF